MVGIFEAPIRKISPNRDPAIGASIRLLPVPGARQMTLAWPWLRVLVDRPLHTL